MFIRIKDRLINTERIEYVSDVKKNSYIKGNIDFSFCICFMGGNMISIPYKKIEEALNDRDKIEDILLEINKN